MVSRSSGSVSHGLDGLNARLSGEGHTNPAVGRLEEVSEQGGASHGVKV